MRFRNPSTVVSVLVLVPALITAFLLLQFLDAVTVYGGNALNRYNAYVLSDGLRQTSDDLTRMVRLYAVTGNPAYRDNFEEILAIRNGDAPRPELYYSLPYWDIVLATGEHPGDYGDAVPIRTLIRDAGFTDEELSLLNESEDRSNDLVQLENEVMASVEEQRAAGAGEYLLEGAAVEAMRRLHSQEYHEAKNLVMTPLVAIANAIDESVDEVKTVSEDILRQAVSSITITSVMMILLSLAAAYLRYRELKT